MPIVTVPASKVKVEPAYMKGHEAKGLLYFIGNYAPVLGAQCAVCHTILWVFWRRDPILNEVPPPEVPDSGPGYERYYKNNLARFLASLPPCPNCGQSHYDRFINNVKFPRHANGEDLDKNATDADIVKIDPRSVEVFVLDEAGDLARR